MAEGLAYNGWPASVRHSRDRHYYHARKCGILPPATNCAGCEEFFTAHPIPYHSEEYGPTLEDYWKSCAALCHRCHAMLHARFATPNLWKRYLSQIADGRIDGDEFPQRKQIVALLSKFKARGDTSFVPMPDRVSDYFRCLPPTEYKGPEKIATLLVRDGARDRELEVPDWTIYGINLELLNNDQRDALRAVGVEVDRFLKRDLLLPTSKDGRIKYRRLYMETIK